MIRKAFLHIGLPKTGTTYLQHILWENKEPLKERGLLLPGATRRRHLLASLDVREDPKLARRAGDVESPWQDLVDECLRWDSDVLISHEFFAAATTGQARRAVAALAGFEVHVIITARPMVALGVSRWQEWVKSGGTLPIDDYPKRTDYDPTDEWGWGSFDLADILDRWGAVLEHPHIHVLPVAPPGAAPNDLWLRLAQVLGVDGRELPVADLPANASLGVVEVELLRRVNPLLHDFKSAADRGNWIRGFLAEGSILPDRPEKFRAGDVKQQELMERGERAVAQLRAGSFDVQGDVSWLEDEPQTGLRHPQEVSDAEILESATQAMANMLRSIRSLTEERDKLVRRSSVPVAAAAAGRVQHWWSRAARKKSNPFGGST